MVITIMNFFSKLPYSIRFLLLATSAGILISLVPFSHAIIQLQKSKIELNKNIDACYKAITANHGSASIGNPKKLILECEPDFLAKAHASGLKLNGIQKKIMGSFVNYLLALASSTPSEIFHLPIIIILISIIFGVTPMLWVFLLNRICDISNAIRGNRR